MAERRARHEILGVRSASHLVLSKVIVLALYKGPTHSLHWSCKPHRRPGASRPSGVRGARRRTSLNELRTDEGI